MEVITIDSKAFQQLVEKNKSHRRLCSRGKIGAVYKLRRGVG